MLSHYFKRKFSILFMLIFLLISITAYYAYRSDLDEVYEGLDREGSVIFIGKGLISHLNEQLVSDVLYLTDNPVLEKLLRRQDESLHSQLAADWVRFSRNKRIYDQIRWIDQSGMERVRVNFNGGKPFNVAKQNMSDKSKRYYFRETIKLGRNEFYISRFDLNVENEEIEKPYKPMIRICIPLFDNLGERHGILVMNYLGSNLLERLRSVVDSNTWLVDEEGYWLMGPSSGYEWGFMFNKPSLSMAQQYPDAWRKIIGTETGHLETAAGYWKYLTVNPIEEFNLLGRKNFPMKATMSTSSYGNSRGKWKLIHFISRNEYSEQISSTRTRNIIYTAIALCVLALILYYIARSDARLFESEQQQHAIIDSADFTIISTDVNGVIRTFNSVAERLLGYKAEEVVGKMTPEVIHEPREVIERAKTLSKELGREIKPGFEVFVARAILGIPDENDWTYIRKDNSCFPVRLSVTALKDSDGYVTGFLGVGHDISIRKAAEMELQKFRQRMALATDSAHLGVWEYNLVTRHLEWNNWMYELYGVEKDTQASYEIWESALYSEDKQFVLEQLDRAITSQQPFDIEFRIIRPDGERVWIKANAIILYDEKHQPVQMIGVNYDITQRKDSEVVLRRSEEQFRTLLDSSPTAVRIAKNKGRDIVYANPAYHKLINVAEGTAMGKDPASYYANEKEYEEVVTQLQHGRKVVNKTIELVIPKKGKKWVLATYLPMHYEGELAVLGWFADITELKRQQNELERIAHFDPLTGLPNRLLLSDRIRHGITQADRHKKKVAVVFIDLDGFKEVNDSYGHDIGDSLLVLIAEKLKKALRKSDTLARLAGDEFVAIIEDLDDTNASLHLVDRMLVAAARPIKVEGHVLQISASIGITFYPQPGKVDTEQLLQQADQAMYQAKKAGKNRYHIFDEHD